MPRHPDELLTTSAAADYIRDETGKVIGAGQILRYVKTGGLPATNANPGGQARWVIRAEDALKLAEQLPNPGSKRGWPAGKPRGKRSADTGAAVHVD